MKTILESPKNSEAHEGFPGDELSSRQGVLQELDNILSSRNFRSADRCKQFLRYVVLSKLDGQTERLKERTIGTEMFRRSPGYATGEDPVVRVQAGEVRRRLVQYYQEAPQPSPVRIELPVGSYSPVFHWDASPGSPKAAPREFSALRSMRQLKPISFVAIAILAVLGVTAVLHSLFQEADSKTALTEFWGPAITSHQPILICLANASNSPSGEDSQPSSSQAQSISPQTGVQAIDASLALIPDEDSANNQSAVSPEIVPAADASVAVALSALFGKLNKTTQLRIGATATYEDISDFPTAVIGGFNNRWTMQLVSNLHYAFLQTNGQYMIREQVPGGRTWTTRLGPRGETVEDFAIVSRLIDSKTGQFTVTVAGIGPRGTEAAGEFVSSSRELKRGLSLAPAGWQNRNLEVLLETSVTDSVAGPPRVIGIFAW